MTRWCPVCESAGIPVVTGTLTPENEAALTAGRAVRVNERLPEMTPSHFCSRCPTFFRARDRFYLTSRHETRVHGIAVWPHNDTRLRVEVGDLGVVALWRHRVVAIPGDEFPAVFADAFRGTPTKDLLSWGRRHGHALGLANGSGGLRITSEPSCGLVVSIAKKWFRKRQIRTADETAAALRDMGVHPIVLGPSGVHS